MGRGGSGGASCLCGSAKCYAAALSKPILRLFCGWLLVPVLFLVHHHNALCVNCRNCGATHAVSTCSTLHTTTVYYSTYVKQDVHCQDMGLSSFRGANVPPKTRISICTYIHCMYLRMYVHVHPSTCVCT